jgi:hypothetical protein
VAGFATWHEAHEVAHGLVRERPFVPAHVALETYSVLTRLPPPHRVPAKVAGDFVGRVIEGRILVPPDDVFDEVIRLAARQQISGGAIFDAFIALTVLRNGATLSTRDRRALRTYEAVGVSYELLGLG